MVQNSGYYQLFIRPRWLGMGFLNHQQYHWKEFQTPQISDESGRKVMQIHKKKVTQIKQFQTRRTGKRKKDHIMRVCTYKQVTSKIQVSVGEAPSQLQCGSVERLYYLRPKTQEVSKVHGNLRSQCCPFSGFCCFSSWVEKGSWVPPRPIGSFANTAMFLL